MYYFRKKNLAFFHIPRTSGTSFIKFLRGAFGKDERIQRKFLHESILVKKQVMGENLFKSINVITILRNPYDMIVSYFAWINGENMSERGDKKYPFSKEFRGLPFKAFVEGYVKRERSYSDYLLINGKMPENLLILKFESLAKDTKQILQMDLKMSHIYKTDHEDYRMYYNSMVKVLVEEKFQWAFDEGLYKKL